MGGAISGGATACLLLRANPALRVLILERNSTFKRRVGESTVEVSAFFLGRILDLTDHLLEKHLVKQGLRFWFKNEQTAALDECSEIGPGYNVRLPGYQVDRAVLDEEVLSRAVTLGAVVRRPILVRGVDLEPGGLQTLNWEDEHGGRGAEKARWVVDASGVGAVLARKNGWLSLNREHPIAAVWSRWSGVKNWDSRALANKYPEWARRTKAVRFTATNHLLGRGWWAWLIPLKGGDVSIGLVFDQRLVELAEGEHLGERLRTMLETHPVARELLADATWNPGDVHFRRNLAYSSSTFAGDGHVLVGDAAAFIDPFYSPGLDWISYSASAAAKLVGDSLTGTAQSQAITRHNALFSASYQRWFTAIYRDKYLYMGDYELMSLAFRLDLGLYYAGVASQPFKHGAAALETPAFAGPGTFLPAHIIAFYNRRLAAMGRERLRRGTWGRQNSGRHLSFRSYELSGMLYWRLVLALLAYLKLELSEGWRSWFRATELSGELPPHPSRSPARAQVHRASTPPHSRDSDVPPLSNAPTA